jgi:hypothetical protein
VEVRNDAGQRAKVLQQPSHLMCLRRADVEDLRVLLTHHVAIKLFAMRPTGRRIELAALAAQKVTFAGIYCPLVSGDHYVQIQREAACNLKDCEMSVPIDQGIGHLKATNNSADLAATKQRYGGEEISGTQQKVEPSKGPIDGSTNGNGQV